MNLSKLSPSLLATLAMVLSMVAVPALALATPSFSLPTSDVLGYIAICVAFIVAVGGGVLGMIYIGKAFKWGRRAG